MKGYRTVVSLKHMYAVPAASDNTELLVGICRWIAQANLAEGTTRPQNDDLNKVAAEIREAYGLAANTHPDQVIDRIVTMAEPVEDILDTHRFSLHELAAAAAGASVLPGLSRLDPNTNAKSVYVNDEDALFPTVANLR